MPEKWNPEKFVYIDSFTYASKELTALAKAAYRGELEYLKEHLRVETTIEPLRIYVALAEACVAKHLLVVKYLLDLYPPGQWKAATIERNSQNKWTGKIWTETMKYPADLARSIVVSDNGPIVRLFFEHGMSLQLGDVDNDWVRRCLDCPNALDVFLEYGADPYRKGYSGSFVPDLTPIADAMVDDNTAAVAVFLKHGVKFGDALYWGARWGSVASMSLLLEAGQDVNQHFFLSDEDLVVFIPPRDSIDIIENIPTGNVNVGTALHAAATVRHHSADIEQFTGGDTEMIELLVKHGADINAKDQYNRTPLDIAMWSFTYMNSPEGLKMLGATERQVERKMRERPPPLLPLSV